MFGRFMHIALRRNTSFLLLYLVFAVLQYSMVWTHCDVLICFLICGHFCCFQMWLLWRNHFFFFFFLENKFILGVCLEGGLLSQQIGVDLDLLDDIATSCWTSKVIISQSNSNFPPSNFVSAKGVFLALNGRNHDIWPSFTFLAIREAHGYLWYYNNQWKYKSIHLSFFFSFMENPAYNVWTTDPLYFFISSSSHILTSPNIHFTSVTLLQKRRPVERKKK